MAARRPATRPDPGSQADVAARVERFFARHLRHVKPTSRTRAGSPFKLEKWQRDELVRPLFNTLDRKGLRRYREGLVGMPRKNGKSAVASGLGLYATFFDGVPLPDGGWDFEYGAEVYALASSRDQARVVFNVARSMVEADPELDSACRVFRDVIEVRETGAIFRVLASDAPRVHGLNPSFAVVDELHAHKSPDLYEAIRSAIGARRQPLILNISTAGHQPKGVLWDLYRRGLAGRDPRLFFRWWGVPDDADWTDTKEWTKANPASWVTIPILRDLRRGLPEPIFRQLHLNQWVSASKSWVNRSTWDACAGPPEFDPNLPVVIGVDGAYKRDLAAVVMVQRDDDGIHNVTSWTFDPADSPDGYLDYERVEDLLRELCAEWLVERIVVDPQVMIRSMLMLAAEGLPVEDFPQSHGRMIPACQTLHDLVVDERIRHGGEAVLTDHSMNATAKQVGGAWRLDKISSAGKIDAIIAAAMACQIAEQEADLEEGFTIEVV